jgi:hypothetical protein
MAKKQRHPGGRPRKADRSRPNRPPRDLGPPEIQRLRAILNPGQPGLPADPLAALLARNFIDERSYNAGRYFSALVAISRRGWDLRDGSVAQLYRRMVAGIVGEDVGTIPIPDSPVPNGHDRSAADRAREWLREMRAELARDPAILQVVTSIVIDGRWEGWCKRLLTRLAEQPGDWRCLGDLREGLRRLAELGTSRRQEVSPACAAAE